MELNRFPELKVEGGESRAYKEKLVLNMRMETSHSKTGEKEERMQVDEDSNVVLHGRTFKIYISLGLTGEEIC